MKTFTKIVRHFFFLTPFDRGRIKEAVRQAEKRTSGEIRVHIEPRMPLSTDSLSSEDRARALFMSMGMDRTSRRNAVLIYVAWKDREIAVIGDEGVNGRVTPGYWYYVIDHAVGMCRRGQFADGICDAVYDVGLTLERLYPPVHGDRNELPDEASES